MATRLVIITEDGQTSDVVLDMEAFQKEIGLSGPLAGDVLCKRVKEVFESCVRDTRAGHPQGGGTPPARPVEMPRH